MSLNDHSAEIEQKDRTTPTTKPRTEDQESLPIWETHPQNPFNWSTRKKQRQFLIGCFVTMLVGLNSTVIATPGTAIAKQFNVDTGNPNLDNTVWPIAAWNSGAAVGPMIGIPLLEAFGMKNGYFVIYALFFLFVVPQAVAQSFTTLIVTRTFAGVFGGILMNCLACFVADIWLTDRERDRYITLFILVYLSGVTMGPAFGAIVASLEWRWVFYIQLIIYGALFPLLLLSIKETRGPVIRARLIRADPTLAPPLISSPLTATATSKEQQPSTLSRISSTTPSSPPLKSLLYIAAIRPFHMLFTEPVIVAFTLWSAFCFGIVYTSIQSISQIYSANYNFTDAQNGLLQLSILIGLLLGLPPSLLQNTYYHRDTNPLPEKRLPLSILASLLCLSGGLFWYAWTTSSPHIHWIVPTISLALIGAGVQIVVTAVALYTADAYSLFAGSALSAVGFGENLMAAWLPLATRRMYNALGNQWAGSVLGFAALGLTAAPIVLLVWGDRVRARSRFIREARYLG